MNRYRNFDIDLLDHHDGDDGESLRARVVRSPVGEQLDSDAPVIPFPVRLRGRLRKLEKRNLTFDELIVLGEELASLLLPPAVREMYRRSRDRLKADQGLRIRIRPHDPELAVLPWEYVYVERPDVPPGRKGPEGFLAVDRTISLVRYEIAGEPPAPIESLEHYDIRTIALLSDVKDPAYPELDFDREELNLRQALEGVAGIDTRFLRPGTPTQLDEILGEDAQVFHFSGHGEMEKRMGEEPGTVEGDGRLILSGDDGRPEPLDVRTLALELKGKGIRLAVLNACEAAGRDSVTPWSGIAPALARQGIPAVIGMQYTIRDSSAIAFSRRFYRALAAGESIDTAVSEGRLGILSRGGGEERDWGVPVLYMRTERSVLFPPPIIPLRRNLALASAALVLLSAWFYLHIYPLVAAGANRWLAYLGLGAGAVAGALAVLKITWTYVSKSVKSEKGSIIERGLRQRQAKGILLALFLASILLFFTTSSVYLTHDDDSVEAVSLAVETKGGLPFPLLPELAVEPETGRTLAGGPLFLFPPPSELLLRVSRPLGSSLPVGNTISPRPWRRIDLRVSRDLEKLNLRVLRLVPNNILTSILPGHLHAAPGMTYRLRITVNDQEFTVDDMRQGVVIAGGPVELLQNFMEREGAGDRLAALEQCLLFSNESRNEMMRMWNANIIFRDTPIIGENDSVIIEVQDVNSLKVWSNLSIPAGSLSADIINTTCLELQN